MKEPQNLCQGQKKHSCPWNKDIIVWERWEMGDGRRKWEKKKKKKKSADHVRDKWEAKLVRELVSEYYSSKFVSIFTH
jgi:hypothetical protein